MTYHCLNLFSGLGGFSQAFRDSDLWRVTTIDIQEQFTPDIQADVMQLRPSDLLDRGVNPDLVLASPPCTQFSTANQLNGAHEPDPDHIALAHHTIGLIQGLQPTYWYLENPRGLLRRYIGPPTATVTYCQYGEKHQKPTDLWGRHPPMNYRSCRRGANCHINTREGCNAMRHQAGKKTAAERAKVPAELSQQIHDTVTDALQHTPPQQTTLTTAAPDGGADS